MSLIACNKFVDGLKQGLITSGLNNAAHALVTRYKIDGYLKQKGVNPTVRVAAEHRTAEGIKQFIKMITALGFDYLSADSSSISVSDQQYGTGDSKKASATYSYGERNITVYQSSFKNYRYLALTLGHEIQHAIHFVRGVYSNWVKQHGKLWAKSETEIRAYQWMIDYSSNSIPAPWVTAYSFISFSHQRDFFKNLQIQGK